MSPSLVAEPFPHCIERRRWGDDLLRTARDEFDLVPAWQEFRNPREHKDACTFEAARGYGADACWAIRERLAGAEFIGELEALTGLAGLQYDELGGGLHRIPVGGFLAVHLDFNRDNAGRYRRINVLLYLNERWDPVDGGWLELRGYAERDGFVGFLAVMPEFNTQVTFICSERSWHGHPVRTQRERRSLAAYYFTAEPPPDYTAPHDTVFAA